MSLSKQELTYREALRTASALYQSLGWRCHALIGKTDNAPTKTGNYNWSHLTVPSAAFDFNSKGAIGIAISCGPNNGDCHSTGKSCNGAAWVKDPSKEVCGSGILVVDFDLLKEKDPSRFQCGVAFLNRLLSKRKGGLKSLKTPIVKTQSGGYHLYFKYDPSIAGGTCVVLREHYAIAGKTPLVDVKSDHGRVNAPPSIGEKGAYEWVHSPEDYDLMDIADFPELYVALKKRGEDDFVDRFESSTHAALKVSVEDISVWKDLLRIIRPDLDRSNWILVGSALRNQFYPMGLDDDAFELWRDWSTGELGHGEPSNVSDSFVADWKSLKPRRACITSLFRIAKDQNPKEWKRWASDHYDLFSEEDLLPEIVNLFASVKARTYNTPSSSYSDLSKPKFEAVAYVDLSPEEQEETDITIAELEDSEAPQEDDSSVYYTDATECELPPPNPFELNPQDLFGDENAISRVVAYLMYGKIVCMANTSKGNNWAVWNEEFKLWFLGDKTSLKTPIANALEKYLNDSIEANEESESESKKKVKKRLLQLKLELIKSTTIGHIVDFLGEKLLDPSFASKLDRTSNKYPVGKTKVVDLRTGAVSERKWGHHFTRSSICLPGDGKIYGNHEAGETEWSRYIKTMFPDASEREFMQLSCGAALTLEPLKHFFVWIGKTNTGKSTFGAFLRLAMGEFFGAVESSIFFKTGQQKLGGAASPHLVPFNWLRAGYFSEPDEKSRFDEANAKRFTGDDPISIRGLYKDQQEIIPSTKLFCSTNMKPTFNIADTAFLKRLVYVNFRTEFSEEPLSGQLLASPAEVERLKRNPAFISSALGWLVDGARKFYSRGCKLDVPEEFKAFKEEAVREIDSVASFLKEGGSAGEYELDPELETKASILYEDYKSFCIEEGQRYVNVRDFKKSLEERSVTSKRKNAGNFYIGIGVRQTGLIEHLVDKVKVKVHSARLGGVPADQFPV